MQGLAAIMTAMVALAANAQDSSVLNIVGRLEPFVDNYLIDGMNGVSLKMAEPVAREIVLRFDRPWEGRHCGYITIIKDEPVYRLYYRGLGVDGGDGTDAEFTCYAESVDGIHFTKPALGLFEYGGSKDNNIVLAKTAPFSHNFAPFLDTRPGVPTEERYKALAGVEKSGLCLFVSPDGIHWHKLREEPVITKGAFDSQNVGFWSESEQCYVCYFRTWVEGGYSGYRTISRTTSPDLLNWTAPERMTFGDVPMEHLYINQTRPYFRAPHLYVSLAARFMQGRRVVPAEMAASIGAAPDGTADCSDTVLMTTRGGTRYDRTFMESFVRPGIGLDNWVTRTNYSANGVVPTGTAEMSFYVERDYGLPTACLQRMTLRTDGFASIHAPFSGGEFRTKTLEFAGKQLALNYSTSSAGSIAVEVQNPDGTPVPGYARADAQELVGDAIERPFAWKDKADVSELAGKSVRLVFIMKDADLYSIRFRE
ncbi:MAG: hypothetical protein NTU83_07425 [Candidatus Hydrogenedentes bacterium]|nr:hypothetical protein [Candidatus Hydrogenedentota bacterium]